MLVKLEWLGYRMVEKLWRYVNQFSYNTSVLRTDGRTDRIAIYQYRASAAVCWRAIKRDCRTIIVIVGVSDISWWGRAASSDCRACSLRSIVCLHEPKVPLALVHVDTPAFIGDALMNCCAWTFIAHSADVT